MSVKNKRNLYLAASVLLHLLAGLVIWALTQLNLLAFAEPTSQLPDDPLVFELQQDQRRHEVVETPEDARVDEAPEDAQLASDKNARAQNAEAPADLDLGEAFAKGDFDFLFDAALRYAVGLAVAVKTCHRHASRNTC